MRKPRVILFDDDLIVLDVLRNFFAFRNYEVLAYSEPSICPVYGDGEHCVRPFPCSDMMITDYRMPRMNGIEVMENQARRGCKLSPKNKALISGFLREEELQAVRRLGISYLEKPFTFDELGSWVDECESRMDLSNRIGSKRREERTACREGVGYQVGADTDIRRGVLINRSGSGACMEADELIPTDHSVTLHRAFPAGPAKVIIRWTKATSDKAYCIGLQYH